MSMEVRKESQGLKNSMVTDAELSAINAFTKRALGADEVYTFAVRLCDASMEPLIRNGSICYVKKTKNILVGNIGVFEIGGKLYVRKVEKENITAVNKTYPSFSINDYEKFEGIVVDFTEY